MHFRFANSLQNVKADISAVLHTYFEDVLNSPSPIVLTEVQALLTTYQLYEKGWGRIVKTKDQCILILVLPRIPVNIFSSPPNPLHHPHCYNMFLLFRSGCFQSEAGKGEEYRGDINYTDDFITCQKWTAQWPHKHEQYSSKPRKNERNGLGEHNYCRNPDSKRKKPWCFTNHKKIRWQYCPIKLC